MLALATGPTSDPTIVSANGQELSADEREALSRIVTATGGIVQLLNDLASPAASIVQMAAALRRS